METARRWIGVFGVAGLVGFGATYWLTHEPAPRVRVRWAADVTPGQRAALERRYLLLNGRDQLDSGSLAYDLLDTSPANVRRLVEDPAIADTNDIERHTFVIPFDVDYGGEWRWAAHRTPVLRVAGIRAAVIVLLGAMALAGLARDALRLWRAIRRALEPSGRAA